MAMPKVTISELLDDINRGTGLLQSDIYREKLTHAINRHVEEIQRRKLNAGPKAPRKVKTDSPLYSLPEWEQTHGPLTAQRMGDWILQNRFCKSLMQQMVEEFRTDMISKAKKYADFRAAFKTYVNRGYLSKKREQLVVAQERSVTL